MGNIPKSCFTDKKAELLKEAVKWNIQFLMRTKCIPISGDMLPERECSKHFCSIRSVESLDAQAEFWGATVRFTGRISPLAALCFC